MITHQCHNFFSLVTDITPPLVVLNNFGQSEESQVKLMRITFQHMFPTINTKTVKLSDCRRVVLYHYHKDEGTVEMRHYAIKAQPVGVSSAVKRILQSRIPNLGDLEDVSQYLEGAGGGAASDSEAEDEISRVSGCILILYHTLLFVIDGLFVTYVIIIMTHLFSPLICSVLLCSMS